MPIHTITNNSGAQLTLWDVGTQLATLEVGQSVHTLPPTITSVTRGDVSFMNRSGAFADGDSYSATYAPGAPRSPSAVVFTGNTNTVRFT